MTFNRPDLAGVARIAKEFMAIAEERGEPVARVLGEQSLGLLAFVRGELPRARERLLKAIEAAKEVADPRALAELQFPTTALSYLSYGELLMGRPASARAIAERSLESYGNGSKFARALALANLLIYQRLAGDEAAARHHLAELKGLAEARGAPYWLNLVLLHESLSAIEEGEVEEGLVGVRKAIETFVASAVEIEIPFYLMLLAERLLAKERHELALPVLAEALRRVETSGERWCFPEILRLRSEAMAGEDPAAAESALKQAIAAARVQGAVLWELRAANTLARIATGRASRQAALDSLRQAVERCEWEGGPLADLKQAKATLASRPPPPSAA